MTETIDLTTWLERFRSSRKYISQGSPLWAYKVTDRELSELQKILLQLTQQRPIDDIIRLYGRFYAEAFVLFAATWLQRNGKGQRKWEPLLSAINAERLAHSDISNLVTKGLRNWGVQVHRTEHSSRYLASLACQGGFPRSDLLQESKTPILEYFNEVLSRFERYQHSESLDEIANQALNQLPITLQQSAFADLVIQLIECLLDWKAHYNLGIYADAVKILDNEHPSWRDELPFMVIDDEARSLINMLLKRAAKFTRREQNPIRVKRKLVPVGDEFRLIAELYIAKEIHPEDLARQLGDIQLPSMFLLSTRTSDGSHFKTASLTYRNGADGGWLVSSYYTTIKNSVAADELSFSIDSDGRHILNSVYYRGEALSENTPWVFEPTSTGLNYVGQGSIKSKASRLVVVSATEPKASSLNASITDEGTLIGSGFRVYEVSGDVQIEGISGNYNISCSAGENEQFKVTLEAAELDDIHAKIPIFRGIPKVSFKRTNDSEIVPQDELFWFHKGSKETISLAQNQDAAIGKGVLVWRRDKSVLWEKGCIILPKDFEYELTPFSGTDFSLKLNNVRKAKIGFPIGYEGWVKGPPHYSGDEIQLILSPQSSTADRLGISLKWNDNEDTECEFELPISFNIASITDRKGHPYHVLERGNLTVNDLPNLQLVVRTEANIESVQIAVNLYGPPNRNGQEMFLMADQRSVEVSCKSGVSTIRGTEISAILNRLFTLTDKLDSYLQIEIFANNTQINSVIPKITRYKHDPKFVDNRTAFTLQPTPTLISSDSPVLFLSPIWDFEQEPIELTPDDPSASVWRFELPKPDDIEYGPWLIWAEPSLSIHPRVKEYPIPFNEQEPSNFGALGAKLLDALGETSTESKVYEENLKPGTVEHKVKYLNPRERESLSSLNKSIRNMGFDINHPGWAYIDGIMKHIDSIEPLSLYAMTSMQFNPRALVVLLFRDSNQFNEAWEVAERLGVSWYSISPEIWISVLKQYFEKFKSDAEALAESLMSISEDTYWNFVFRGFSSFEAKGPYFKYLVDLATDRPAFEPVAIWEDEELKKNGLDDQTVGMYFKEQRKLLLGRHEGKLLSRVGTRSSTEKFLTALEQFWPTKTLPSALYGFIKFTEVESSDFRTKQDAWTITMALPLKLGFCMSGYYQRPNKKRFALQLSQVISRIDQFDREWLQHALIIAHMACETLDLEKAQQISFGNSESIL